jgi:hypothetical protein
MRELDLESTIEWSEPGLWLYDQFVICSETVPFERQGSVTEGGITTVWWSVCCDSWYIMKCEAV